MIKTIILQPKVLAELLTFGTSSYEVREDYIYPVTLSQPFPFAGGSHTTIYVRQYILWASTRENLVRKVKFRLQQVLIQILSNKLTTKALIRSARSAVLLFPNPQRQVFSRRGPYASDFASTLVCSFVVPKPPKTGVMALGPICI